MATIVSFEGQVEVPLNLLSLEDFRQWSYSTNFPQRGRIDFIKGRIEVEMSPEDLFTHGSPKVEIVYGLRGRIKTGCRGRLFTDRTRISNDAADLSAEPDVVFISYETLTAGRVHLVPKATREAGRYLEIEGAADMVAEIVSDSSEVKDTKRLPPAYFQAGVREFWLVDARGEQLVFQIFHRGPEEFEPAVRDSNGYQLSTVFDCSFHFQRVQGADGYWEYDLRAKE